MAANSRFPLLVMVVGVVLLLSPAVVQSFHVGEPTYEYTATELTYEDGSFKPAESLGLSFSIDNIACTQNSRSCQLEHHIQENGRVPVEDSVLYRARYEYAHLDGSMYAMTEETENGTTYLTQERIEPRLALRRSSTSYDFAPPTFRASIDHGTATATTEHESPQVVSKNTNGPDPTFYYVEATSAPSGGVYGPGLNATVLRLGLSGGGFLAGLGLVLRGHKMRIRESWF